MNKTRQKFKLLGSLLKVWALNVRLVFIIAASVQPSAAWADAPSKEPQAAMAVRVLDKNDVESLQIMAFMDRKFKDIGSLHGWVMIGVWKLDDPNDISVNFPNGTEWVETRVGKEGRKKLASGLAVCIGVEGVYETGGAKVRDLNLRALVGVQGSPSAEVSPTKCSLMEGHCASFLFVEKDKLLLVSLK
jgi:hypothetical protein